VSFCSAFYYLLSSSGPGILSFPIRYRCQRTTLALLAIGVWKALVRGLWMFADCRISQVLTLIMWAAGGRGARRLPYLRRVCRVP